MEEDNLFEMNLITQAEDNLEKMEKESKQTLNYKKKEISEVEKNIELLAASKTRKQQKIEYYQQILASDTPHANVDRKNADSKMGQTGISMGG